MTARAHDPQDKPLATVHPIHSGLVRRYNEVYRAQRLAALERWAGEPAEALPVIREDISSNPGKLRLEERATMRAWQSALDELIETRTREQNRG